MQHQLVLRLASPLCWLWQHLCHRQMQHYQKSRMSNQSTFISAHVSSWFLPVYWVNKLIHYQNQNYTTLPPYHIHLKHIYTTIIIIIIIINITTTTAAHIRNKTTPAWEIEKNHCSGLLIRPWASDFFPNFSAFLAISTAGPRYITNPPHDSE